MTHALSASKATQQQTKAHNDSLVLSTIYNEAQAISRAAVARRTALSRTSVGEAVAELLERGLVEEIGLGRPRMGKPPILLQVKRDARHLIGLDLSGEDFRGAVVNLRGEVRHALRLPRDGRSGADAVELVYELVDCLLAKAEAPLLGLGVGAPGLIDLRSGSPVHWAVNLDWLDLPLRDLLEARYGVPAHVVNDCKAAAMGEFFFGSRHATGNLVVIKSEVGLGAGVVLEGRLLHGDHFGAGEIGHLVLTKHGRQCRCGSVGCLESVASATAILRSAREAALNEPGSVLYAMAARELPLDMAFVYDAYLAGDAVARQVVDEAGRALGLAIATIVATLNVQDIVIAGLVTRLGEPLLEIVREEVLSRSLSAVARNTSVAYSAIGADITALGAAAVLLFQELGLWPLRDVAVPG